MGMAVDYFYSLTPRQFANALDGFRAKQQNEFRNHWEQTRLMMWSMLAVHHDAKKYGPLLVTKVMPLDWDSPELDAPALSIDQIQQIREAQQQEWARIDAKLNKPKINT